ncbi:MAG: hypothetical protein ACREVH_04655 [Gammaproteobacteria bacterium]
MNTFRPRFFKAALILAAVTSLAVLVTSYLSKAPTDYEIELAKIENDILSIKASAPSASAERALTLVYLLYLKATLTGRYDDFNAAETETRNTIRTLGSSDELYLVMANLNYTFHRLDETAHDLDRLSSLAASPRAQVLRTNIDLQQGKYVDAKRGYESVIQARRTWDNLARLAYLESKIGDPLAADRLYGEAQDEITAKEMRSYAWVEVQRGLLDSRQGRYEEAWAHYRRADRAYSGYWLIEDHMAELLGAQRKYGEAIARYESVVTRAPRPEFQQAIGDLYALMGQPEQARPWHDKALAAYLASARRGEVHYFHHLAWFYADVREDGAEAVKWARRDLDLRRNYATREALAWALYRAGRIPESLAEIKRSLSAGVKDAHLFFHAAMIYLAAGRTSEGKQFFKRAAAVNPRYEAFHVHR